MTYHFCITGLCSFALLAALLFAWSLCRAASIADDAIEHAGYYPDGEPVEGE